MAPKPKSVEALKKELEKLDQKRAELKQQIDTAELERSSFQQEADRAMQEKAALKREREEVLAQSEHSLQPPVKKRGRPPKVQAQPEEQQPMPPSSGAGTSSAEVSSSKAASKAASKPAATAVAKASAASGKAAKATAAAPPSTAADSDVGAVVNGKITVPSVDDALKASDDMTLDWKTEHTLNQKFRAQYLEKHRSNPGTKGSGERLGYLVARNDKRPSGADGFVMWKEVWGRRDAYDVELLGLSYLANESDPEDNTLAKKLLGAMIARLDTNKGGTISSKVSEKSTTAQFNYWKTLGFNSISGGVQIQRDFGRGS